MKMYEVFKSEGGYRVAGDIYLDGPVIDSSPWRKTEAEAKKLAKKMKRRAEKEWKRNGGDVWKDHPMWRDIPTDELDLY